LAISLLGHADDEVDLDLHAVLLKVRERHHVQRRLSDQE